MCGVVIILHRILDCGFADVIGPIAVPTSDQGHIVEITRVRHRVLLVLQDLVDDGSDFVGVLGRHTAVEHIREIVVINGAIIQVSHFACGITTSFTRDLSCVAHKDKESRRGTLADTSIVEVVHIGLNGVIVTTSLGGSHHIHIKAFLDFPINPRLQSGNVVFGSDDDHVDGIGHQIGMVGVDIHDLAVVEHLFVNDVEIRAVGTQQHALSLGTVGTIEVDFHFNVVENA